MSGIEQVADLSDVVGLGERTVNDTDATPKAQVSAVDGLAERTVVLERGVVGVEVNVFGPDTAFYVSYSGNDVVISGLNSDFNGTYTYIPDANLIATGNTTPQTYAANSSYNVWQKDNGDGTYDVIAYWDFINQWLVYEETTPVTSVQVGDGFGDTSATAVAGGSVTIEVLGTSTTP